MPITGRTPKACFDEFVGHLRSLCAKTLTKQHQLISRRTDDETQIGISFLQRDAPVTVPLKTKAHGTVYFSIAQDLRAKLDEEETYRLETHAYWYRLQSAPEATAQAAIRWEYERKPEGGKKHCRNHVQQDTHVALGTGRLDLNKAHLPTGWVTIEEVLRFLINDLGVKPPCGASWATVLAESEAKFYEEFTSKRYTPPKGHRR